jgi:hypothetical protein
MFSEPDAAVVKRNIGRVVRDTTSATKADALRACALEVIEPKTWIEVSRVIFNKGELHPAHRL